MPGVDYRVYLKIKDKGSDKYLISYVPFKVQYNSFITLLKDEIKFDQIYVWNETKKKIVTDNVLLKDEKYSLFISQISNLKEINEKIYFEVLSSGFETVKYDPKIENYSTVLKFESGISKDLLSKAPIKISLGWKEMSSFPTKLTFEFKIIDLKSDVETNFHANFEVK